METTRRPLTTRNTRWAAAIANFLAQHGVRPNAISMASVVFAMGAGLLLYFAGVGTPAPVPCLFVGAAMLIQFRLLCNLFDGMVAIEGGFKTKSGEIFNELPDRFADAFILIGAGYSEMGAGLMPWLGWASAVLAVITAYVRALGASAGTSQQFCGPMAKPQRMAMMTFACVTSAVLGWMNVAFPTIAWALGIIVVGCLITIFRRTHRIIRELESP